MDPKITKLIDQYLSGTLSPEDKIAFEAQLASNVEIQKEVELQRSVMEAAKRASQRGEIKNAAKHYRRNRLLKHAVLSALITAFVTTTVLFFTNKPEVQKESNSKEFAPISEEVKEKLNKNQDFAHVPIQYFQIPSQGSVQLSNQGVLISVPENAFLKDGKPYKGNVILKYQEAIKGVDIVKSGLSTMSGDNLLETQGMFSVGGFTEEGEQLEFNPEIGVYLQSPVDECKEDMKLYDGKKLEDGTIDWIDPEPLNNAPTPIDMADLDFYPENYESELNKKKWKKDKRSRDSLYLTLQETLSIEEIEAALEEIDQLDLTGDDSDKIIGDPEFPAFYLKEKRKRKEIIRIDDLISWEVVPKHLGGSLWEVHARATLSEGFFIYSSEGDKESLTRTQIKAGPSSRFKVKGLTRDASEAQMLSTKNGKVLGHPDFADFVINIEAESSSQLEIPIRLVFKIGTKNMVYPRVFRNHSVILGQSPEQIKARNDSLARISLTGNFIYPSAVIGFWNNQFNNTNLATLEFQERMKLIHKVCENEVLEMYTNNLDKELSEIDQDVVNMGYSEFQEFADQNVGKIDRNDPHFENLSNFYRKSVDILRKDAKNRVKSEEQRMIKWNELISDQRKKDRTRAETRNATYVNEMKNYNRRNLARQLQAKYGFKITEGSQGSLTAIKNIDRYIPFADAVVPNENADIVITKSQTYEAEPIKYAEMEISVKNHDKYIKLYMYAFADKLNSYQRLNGEDGTFKCNLNSKIKYSIGLVGVTEKGFEYFQKMNVKGGNMGKIQLASISESELERKIDEINSNRLKSISIKDDLTWLRAESKNYRKQALLKDMVEFRRDLKLAIFPCVSIDYSSYWRAMSGTIEEDDVALSEDK